MKFYPVKTQLIGLLSIFFLIFVTADLSAQSNFSKKRMAITKLQDKKLDNKINSLRKKFIAAETALQLKQIKKFKKLLGQLKAYPLYPFLQYQYLRKNISHKNKQELLAFMQTAKETPYADRIYTKWLDYNAKRGNWKTYLSAYRPQSSTSRQCDYLQALLKTGQKQTAFTQVKAIWLTGRSQPKNCDEIFKAWEADGHISSEKRWQRIKLVMNKGRISLAKYLAKPLNKKDQAFLEEWITLYRKPHKLLKSGFITKSSSTNKIDQKHPMYSEVITHSLKRLARKKPELAAKTWLKVDAKVKLSEQEKSQVYRAIGLSFARKHQVNGWYWLDKIPDQYSDKYIQEWRVRAAIREQNWNATLDAIDRLAEKEQQSLRWTYWLGEVNDEFGRSKEANEIYAKLALKRDYYGFLAADKMDMPYSFENSPLVISKAEFKKLEAHPGILSAREFYIMQRSIDARREWYFATSKLFDEKQRTIAAKIAQQWQWHDRAILTIAHTKERDDMELRFPIKFKDKVAQYSQQHKLDDAYTFAVIRRESAFAPDARSPVGALGLMQIMPATGRSVAKKMKLRYKGKSQLLSTELNLKLGTNYLQKMLKKFHQQPVLASAAYNAGGHRVKRWLPKDAKMSAVKWVESIPFKETREYVSAVLAYTSIYQHRLGQSITRLENRMPDVPKK